MLLGSYLQLLGRFEDQKGVKKGCLWAPTFGIRESVVLKAFVRDWGRFAAICRDLPRLGSQRGGIEGYTSISLSPNE